MDVTCPVSLGRYDRIVMGHGSGGSLSGDLLREVFLPAFDNECLSAQEDQATLSVPAGRLAFTTDSFVIRPIFFPGGDVGSLSVHGTLNDLAVGGARPLFLSAAFILEEGLSIADLKRVAASMAAACREAGVTIVAGDTKVVERGKGDQIFITTSGIGIVRDGVSLSARNAKIGDRVLISGTAGDHGIAIMSVREGIAFDTELESDSCCLSELTRAMLEVCPRIRCMRDPTRGGIASALNEIASASKAAIRLREEDIPIRAEVKAACELLGLDPLHVANEGKLVAIVPERDASRLLACMRSHPLGRQAAIIGEVVEGRAGEVRLESVTGGERIVMMLTAEQLPRIC